MSTSRTWTVHARVTGETLVGEFAADTGEDAVALAKASAPVKLCRRCARTMQDIELDNFVAEEIVLASEDGGDYYAESEAWEAMARAAGWKPPSGKRR